MFAGAARFAGDVRVAGAVRHLEIERFGVPGMNTRSHRPAVLRLLTRETILGDEVGVLFGGSFRNLFATRSAE